MGERAYSVEDLAEEIEEEIEEKIQKKDSQVAEVSPLFPDAPHGNLEEQEGTFGALGSKKEAIVASLSQKLFSLVLVEKGFEDLLQNALEQFTKCFQAKYSCILEFCPEKADFFFRALVGPEKERIKEVRISAKKGLLKRFIVRRQAVLLKDLHGEKPHNVLPLVMAYIRPSTMMGIPLYVGDTFYGVIELMDKQDGTGFTEEEKEALEVCSQMLSKVLEVRFFTRELLHRGKRK